MSISLQQWQHMLAVSAELLNENSAYLSRIDGEIGDGDHGITIARIANLMNHPQNDETTTSADMFEKLGWDVTNVHGGSAGPLWGTFFIGMGNVLSLNSEASATDVFEGGLKNLQTISTAKPGDKTMMDAIIPAIDAMKSAAEDLEALALGAQAAKQGAENTKNFVAKFGRAKNYGERSIGYKDAGACSMSLLFEGMYTGFSQLIK